MYNTNIKCKYRTLENINNLDNEEQESEYRKEMLLVFGLEEFDDDKVNKGIDDLFLVLQDSEPFVKCMKKSAIMFFSEDLKIGLMGLFSYDYFYLLHPCICEYLNSNDVSDKINSLLCAL